MEKKSATLSKKNLTVNLHTMKKCLKIEKKTYNGKINTSFHNNKIPKEDSQSICLSVISMESFCRKYKIYHSQVFLEECKYVFKKRTSKFITDESSENSNKKN